MVNCYQIISVAVGCICIFSSNFVQRQETVVNCFVPSCQLSIISRQFSMMFYRGRLGHGSANWRSSASPLPPHTVISSCSSVKKWRRPFTTVSRPIQTPRWRVALPGHRLLFSAPANHSRAPAIGSRLSLEQYSYPVQYRSPILIFYLLVFISIVFMKLRLLLLLLFIHCLEMIFVMI